MPAIQLTPAQRKEHRALAHHLEPVVMIGQDGLSAAVLRVAPLPTVRPFQALAA